MSAPPALPDSDYILILADDAALRRRLPSELEHDGLASRVAHDVGDALEIAAESPPYAVVLDLFGGTEDAWRRIKPAVNGSRLIVGGKFTAKLVAERLRADAYVPNGDVPAIVTAVRSFTGNRR